MIARKQKDAIRCHRLLLDHVKKQQTHFYPQLHQLDLRQSSLHLQHKPSKATLIGKLKDVGPVAEELVVGRPGLPEPRLHPLVLAMVEVEEIATTKLFGAPSCSFQVLTSCPVLGSGRRSDRGCTCPRSCMVRGANDQIQVHIYTIKIRKSSYGPPRIMQVASTLQPFFFDLLPPLEE
jgi:hypothetical protein